MPSKTGYTIHDGGECRPFAGEPPDLCDEVVCFSGPIIVVSVTRSSVAPTGYDEWFDVRTRRLSTDRQ